MKLLWPALALALLSRLVFADVHDDLGFASRPETEYSCWLVYFISVPVGRTL